MSVARIRGDERGYLMVALLVAMSVMAIALSTMLPVYRTVARREREAELIFRGEQYARAIGMFQRKYANALPPDVDVLVKERFLRKKYKDPITGDDFKLLGPGSPELGQALGAPPQDVQDRLSQGRGAPSGLTAPAGRSTFRFSAAGQAMTFSQQASQTAAGQAPGGILAVTSKSSESSLRRYNRKGKYNEWIFMALQASQTAGAPAGSGAQVPGGRGTAVPGGRGFPPAGGRGLPPGGARGRGFTGIRR